MNKDYIVVSTISQFKMKYVMHKDDLRKLNTDIPNPTEQQLIEWAKDTVSSEDVEEFSQSHVAETILDTRDITKEEMLEMFAYDNYFLSSWTPKFIVDWVHKAIKKRK